MPHTLIMRSLQLCGYKKLGRAVHYVRDFSANHIFLHRTIGLNATAFCVVNYNLLRSVCYMGANSNQHRIEGKDWLEDFNDLVIWYEDPRS